MNDCFYELTAAAGRRFPMANYRTYLQRRNNELATQNEKLAANVDELNSQLTTRQSELDKWKPKTKAGWVLRKVRNGLAVVGGVGVVLGAC